MIADWDILRGFRLCLILCSTGQTASVQYGEGKKDQKNKELELLDKGERIKYFASISRLVKG